MLQPGIYLALSCSSHCPLLVSSPPSTPSHPALNQSSLISSVLMKVLTVKLVVSNIEVIAVNLIVKGLWENSCFRHIQIYSKVAEITRDLHGCSNKLQCVGGGGGGVPLIVLCHEWHFNSSLSLKGSLLHTSYIQSQVKKKKKKKKKKIKLEFQPIRIKH